MVIRKEKYIDEDGRTHVKTYIGTDEDNITAIIDIFDPVPNKNEKEEE